MMVGEQRRRACRMFVHRDLWKFSVSVRNFLYTPERLISLVSEPRYWRNGQVVQRPPHPADLPIVYYRARIDTQTSQDIDFARLDMRAVNADLLLPEFEQILLEGAYWHREKETWLYIIYLMRQIDDVRAVPILIRFLEMHIDYKFESLSKSLLESTTLKVLRYYATPEAFAVVDAHHEADQEYTDHFAGKSQGWVLSYP